jgi:hypothetical protein
MSNFSKKWMSYIDGDKRLSELTIPGTHDTGTYTCSDANAFAKCQSMDLSEQLNAGVRFLDIRLRLGGDNDGVLWLYHGDTALNLRFEQDILSICNTFLEANPLETIIMSVKDESKGIDDLLIFNTLQNITFFGVLRPIISRSKYLFTEDRLPKLKEVRGKIVLFRRFRAPASPFPVGINAYDGWPDNSTQDITNAVKMRVQDEYEYYTISKMDHKFKRYVEPALITAMSDNKDEVLYINFTSGTGDIWPKRLAGGSEVPDFRGTNYLLSEFLKKNDNHRYGIIPMDFPDSDLISQLISKNIFNTQQVQIINNTIYELRPRVGLDSCLDVWQNNADAGSEVKISSNNGGNNQHWKTEDAGGGYYYLHPLNAPGKVLDIRGSKIIIQSKSLSENQKWMITRLDNGYFTLKTKHLSNMALDVLGGGASDGTDVVVFDANDNDLAEQWKFIRVPIVNNAVYELYPKVAPRSRLDVWENKTEDNSLVKICSSNGGDNQCWKTEDAGGGYYYLYPLNAPGKILDIQGGSNLSGAKVIINSKNDGNNQKWKITKLSNRFFTIKPANAPNLALAVLGGGAADGTDVVLVNTDDLDPKTCWFFFII